VIIDPFRFMVAPDTAYLLSVLGGLVTQSSDKVTTTFTTTQSGIVAKSRSSTALTGKKYFEFSVNSYGVTFTTGLGITVDPTGAPFGSETYTLLRGNGQCGLNAAGYSAAGTRTSNAAYTFVEGDSIGVAFDATTRDIWFSRNGSWLTGDPVGGTGAVMTAASGTYYPYIGTYSCILAEGSVAYDMHSRASAQVYAAPSGFSPYDPG
jgi:hypothetical protein